MEERQIKSLLEPAAYPEPANDVRLLQTHVSWIFLAGSYAYKIKKPVNFGFLDFSTRERRKFYCHEEVRLNRRLCPDIYLDVIPVREAADGASFHGDGKVFDYAVKMIRLPEERMGDRLLANGELTSEDLKRIAVTIAAFHKLAAQSHETDRFGSLEAIRTNWEENFIQTEEFIGVTISRRNFRLIREWVERFIIVSGNLFAERVKEGFIRECDGDIHLENICLTNRVCIFDCIEFNNRFRCCDTAADIAFLLMDLEFHGRRDLAEICLDEYQTASNDSGAVRLVNFYSVYRAFVRGKVESFRLKDPGIPGDEKMAARERALRYFLLARGQILREKLTPSIIVICGLTGSGKSTIAGTLATELGLRILSSDSMRKELAGIPLHQHTMDEYGAGIYSTAQSDAVYREIVSKANTLLAAGHGVIIDATCQRKKDRDNLRQIAARHRVRLYMIIIEAQEEIIRQRLTERVRQGTGISDGRWEIYLRQKEEFEPILSDEGEILLVNSSAPLTDNVDSILDTLGLVLPPANF